MFDKASLKIESCLAAGGAKVQFEKNTEKKGESKKRK